LPKSLKNLVPQTLGKTLFGFVTFLAVARGPDIRAQRSIGDIGLIPVILRPAASEGSVPNGIAAHGPDLPFSCGPIAAVQRHQTGHSSLAQHFWRVKVGDAD
jgi:hypothetical protein